MKWLEQLARQSVTPPITRLVANNSDAYLESTGIQKLGWRSFRRQLAVALTGQNSHCHHTASPTWKKGLWVYEGIPQIGDALMDLAPRSLFALCDVTLDLVAPPHISSLFQNDPWFCNVYSLTQISDFKKNHYDFVIAMSHKHRSLKYKKKLCPALPWLSIHEHFTGPEFQRAEFATQRIVSLFNIEISHQDFNYHAQQKLKPFPDNLKTIPNRPLAIGITVGGVDGKRIYQHWVSVLQQLEKYPLSFVLLGSENGTSCAQSIEALCPCFKIDNQVNRRTLADCRDIMAQLDLVLCCDGGLMHLALTTTTPAVCLFNSLVDPDWRLPQSNNCTALQSSTAEVSGIAPELIASKVVTLLNLEPSAE